jgi:hypothetical protein
MQYTNKSGFFEIELDEFGFNVTIRTFCYLFAVYIRPRWRWDFDLKNVGWYFYQKVRSGFGFLRIEYINYAKSTYHRKEVRRKAIYRDMRFWRIFFRKGEKE